MKTNGTNFLKVIYKSMGKMPALPWLPCKQPQCSHATRRNWNWNRYQYCNRFR